MAKYNYKLLNLRKTNGMQNMMCHTQGQKTQVDRVMSLPEISQVSSDKINSKDGLEITGKTQNNMDTQRSEKLRK